MKMSKVLAPVAVAAAALFGAAGAQAGLIVEVSSGATTVTIGDGSVLDGTGFAAGVASFFSGTSGVIGYAGAVGSWEVSVAIASGIANPFQMHLTASVTGTSGDGPITLKLTQTDLQAGDPMTTIAADGGGSGFGSASWSSWVDDSNAAFGQGTFVHGGGYGGGTWGASTLGLTGTYSATLITTFSYANYNTPIPFVPQTSSLDVGMQVPEPTSIALVGLALLGAGFAARRKAR